MTNAGIEKGARMKNSRRLSIATLMVVIGVLCACAGDGPGAVTPEVTEATAREAYVWGFPMVMNFKTLYNYPSTRGRSTRSPARRVCSPRTTRPW
jgi:hypothetical protein